LLVGKILNSGRNIQCAIEVPVVVTVVVATVAVVVVAAVAVVAVLVVVVCSTPCAIIT